jgi:hypothetical protein
MNGLDRHHTAHLYATAKGYVGTGCHRVEARALAP